MKANHLLRLEASYQHIGLRLECLHTGKDEHLTVNAEQGWALDELADLDAEGLVDRSTCWVHDWIDDYGDDLLPKGISGFGPWPVGCWFNGDSLCMELADWPDQ